MYRHANRHGRACSAVDDRRATDEHAVIAIGGSKYESIGHESRHRPVQPHQLSVHQDLSGEDDPLLAVVTLYCHVLARHQVRESQGVRALSECSGSVQSDPDRTLAATDNQRLSLNHLDRSFYRNTGQAHDDLLDSQKAVGSHSAAHVKSGPDRNVRSY
jgi:hypothetical protein